MKKKRKNGKKFGIIALGAFVATLLFAVFSLSRTVKEISDVAISKTPTAILASAGVSDGRSVNVPILYYDQKADGCVNLYDLSMKSALESRQFEWSECEYYNKQIEQGLVGFELSEQFLPVFNAGELVSNRGLSESSRWFSSVDGKSASYTGTIRLDYKANGAEFSFYKNEFYPLDEAVFSKDDSVNKDGHNHLFTMNFAVPFTALLSGDEMFMVNADDDTFVFVGDKLVIDMGGVHDATTGVFQIHENGEIYVSVDGEAMGYSGVNVGSDEGAIVRIFHADRDSADSVFNMKFVGMNLALVDTKLADNGEDNIQVAYDPNNPSYIAPLGESKVFKPSSTKGLIIVATVEGVVLVAFSVFTAIMIKVLMNRKK